MTISLLFGYFIAATWLQRNANNSCFCRVSQEIDPFSGSLYFPFIFLLIPLLHFSLVGSLMLLDIHVSHIASTRAAQLSNVLIYVEEIFDLHIHQKVKTLPVGSRCTTAAPSSNLTPTKLGGSLCISFSAISAFYFLQFLAPYFSFGLLSVTRFVPCSFVLSYKLTQRNW